MMKWLYFCIIFFTTVKSNVIYEISSENVQYNTQTQTEIIATKKPLFDFLTTFCENLIPKVIRDPECADQLQFICIRQDVLLQMLDATGKYSGMLYGSKYDWGNFDQCIDLNYQYKHGNLVGKYCPYLLMLPDRETGFANTDNMIRLAACIPGGCRLSIFAEDEDNRNALEMLDSYCVTKESVKKLSIGNIVVITTFAVWFSIILICTCYDIGIYAFEKGCHHPNLIYFSLFSNFKKLVTVKKNPGNYIEVLDGMRVISISWIIAGHGFSGWVDSLPATNGDTVTQFGRKIYSSYINGAHLAVDTFFYMSGFLAAFNYLKSKPKPILTQIASVPGLYLHRYLRLTLPFGTVYVFALWIFPKLGTGPIWSPATQAQYDTCVKYWWTVFLYVQNYYNYDDLCIIPTWYLSADMQMWILAPIVLIPLSVLLKKESRLWTSIVFLGVVNIILILMPMAISYYFTDYNNAFDTHSRLIDFTLGMTMATLMLKSKDLKYLFFIDKKYTKVVSIAVWSIILSVMFIIVLLFQPADITSNRIFKICYLGLSKPVWCIGLCWIIYSCYYGYGGAVNWILTRNILKIISRLSYNMYLLHYLIIAYYVLSNRSRLYFSDYQEFHLFCGYFAETLMVSLIWSLVFEYPILSIEKILLRKKRIESGK